jgi:Putative transposase/Transposase zinc-binding domain
MEQITSSNKQRGIYTRRSPEETLLYQTIQHHMNSFFAQCDQMDKAVPVFVKKEFTDYLRCGILANGFARIYCQECRFDRLVAFSCKKRGFCMSCIAKRNNETAAHLVDSVIPWIPTRQWVLSLPMPLRYLVAYNPDALKVVIDSFTSGIFAWLKRQAKKNGITVSFDKLRPGSITFVQRFGSAMNLNVHLHAVFSDGVFIEDEAEMLIFNRLAGPTLDDIRCISEKIALRVHKWLCQKVREEDADDFAQKQPLLAACYSASMRHITGLGKQAGQPLLRLLTEPEQSMDISDREARTVQGYNLYASNSIEAADRQGLERQLRYMGRPPISAERLKLAPDGRIILKLKKAWSNGTSHIILTAYEFLERLVAMVPPPRKNLIRYHGIFAPNAKWRKAVVPGPAKEENQEDTNKIEPALGGIPKKNIGFAKLMARVFGIDVLSCPRCSATMQVISFITEHKVICDILTSLKMPTAPPEAAMASIIAEQESLIFDCMA